jgi:hypothetical protein
MKTKNFFLIVLLSLVVSACTGTGSKTFPDLNLKINQSGSSLFFFRPGAYVAGGVIPSIIVNGNVIGTLGNDEYLSTMVEPGEFSILTEVRGLNSIGMETVSKSGVAKPGKNFFYIVNLNQKFFTARFDLIETTESGFKQAR